MKKINFNYLNNSQFICFNGLNTTKVPNASAMYNLTMRLTAAVSIAISSNYFIKFKKQIFYEISDNYNIQILTLSALEKDNINSKFLDNLIFLYERESFIMAFNKISFISFWTSIIPLLLLFIFYNKINLYNQTTIKD